MENRGAVIPKPLELLARLGVRGQDLRKTTLDKSQIIQIRARRQLRAAGNLDLGTLPLLPLHMTINIGEVAALQMTVRRHVAPVILWGGIETKYSVFDGDIVLIQEHVNFNFPGDLVEPRDLTPDSSGAGIGI